MSQYFNEIDLEEFQKRGISLEDVLAQLTHFNEGFKPANLVASAMLGNGILDISSELNFYIDKYERADISTLKFVPASGAATRMFKKLFEFRSEGKKKMDTYRKMVKEKGAIYHFIKQLDSFAFYEDLQEAFEQINGYSIEEAHLKQEYDKILDALLNESGLNYGKLPKGLLKFHVYQHEVKTAAQEHLAEGKAYSAKQGKICIHFTVSPEHQVAFESHVASHIVDKREYEISYSTQKSGTDTIAVNLDNSPFRDEKENLLFRPAGHGALLENLNELNADIIFIKNIDNVVPDRLKSETITYKKAIAGVLLTYQQKAFELLKRNERGDNIDELGLDLLEKMGTKGVGPDEIVQKLNRPIRVCGMVRNEGEPGGGPFWIVDKGETTSLQIVESAQVENTSNEQLAIFKESTHFNPVDLVCGIKNYKGEKFDLLNFRDTESGFISEKSRNGEKLKAMELPGLWNGSMADWNTIFVEVPLSTFNPVKTVNDLLKEEHR
jgi:hypothetical protein